MAVHRAPEDQEEEARVAAAAKLLGASPNAAATARSFRTPHLHVYPRIIYAAVRRRIEAAHGGTRLGEALAATARDGKWAGSRDLLGNYALLYGARMMTQVPLGAGSRRERRLPPPIIRPPFFGV